MKRLLFPGIIILLISCMDGADIIAPVEYNVSKSDTVSIELGMKNYAYINNELKILFEDVPEDSRCPLGVMCVWAGNAVVRLKVSLGSEIKTVELNTFQSFGDSYYIDDYLIRLKSLSPYPVFPDSIDKKDYVAELEIIKAPLFVRIENESELDRIKKDPFVINKIDLSNDKLFIRVSYSGGCSAHEFRAVWYYPPYSSRPDANLYLFHDSHGDMCEAYLSDTVVVDLKPVKQYFNDMNPTIGGVYLQIHQNLEFNASVQYRF
ncbi:hypothetical protein ACSSWA_13640 [Melioribacter sp. Ez-97]|uniref:hypothetical protein n=1 Tax=Melioribacter sp. Ez-97 TaxID=3423434 RepID=UPI003EDA196F